MSRLRVLLCLAVVSALAAVALIAPVSSQTTPTPKSGGVLNMMLREDLSQGFSIHETSTISTVWQAMPCLNNLVLFDQNFDVTDEVLRRLDEQLPTLTVNFVAPAPVAAAPGAQPAAASADQAPPSKKKK